MNEKPNTKRSGGRARRDRAAAGFAVEVQAAPSHGEARRREARTMPPMMEFLRRLFVARWAGYHVAESRRLGIGRRPPGALPLR